MLLVVAQSEKRVGCQISNPAFRRPALRPPIRVGVSLRVHRCCGVVLDTASAGMPSAPRPEVLLSNGPSSLVPAGSDTVRVHDGDERPDRDGARVFHGARATLHAVASSLRSSAILHDPRPNDPARSRNLRGPSPTDLGARRSLDHSMPIVPVPRQSRLAVQVALHSAEPAAP